MDLKPIENMTDEEVLKELTILAEKQQCLDFIKSMLASGAGERQLLNMLRGVERQNE